MNDMNQLHEETYVNCPVSQAAHHLEVFFREHAQLTLQAPVAIPGIKTDLLMRRDVKVAIERQMPAAPDVMDRLAVRWEAVGGGPFPRFEGTIAVKGDEDYDSFRLALDGGYEPPLGIAGEAFDLLVGRWIAIATARDLLARVRDAVESAYRAQEAKKIHPATAPR